MDLDLDLDPHSEKLLNPDPQKMNADPQPCLKVWVGSGSGLAENLVAGSATL